MSVRPLIEQWFPAATVGAESLRERGSAKAYPPINFLHVWWARRPLAASRAAVVATLLPAWPSDHDVTADPKAGEVRKVLETEFPRGQDQYHQWFIRALGILGNPVAARRAIAQAKADGRTTDGNAYGYDRAFSRAPSTDDVNLILRLASLRAGLDDPPSVLDPFAGGGSIPFETARLGCRAIANELNPVAASILYGTVELPALLGPPFAQVIERWGTEWAARVGKRLKPYFPTEQADERLAYIWAHTVPCPTTGHPTPLAPDYWLAHGKAGRNVAVKLEPNFETGGFQTDVVEGPGATEWGRRATYKSGVGTSLWTGETFGRDYIRHAAVSGQMGEMLLAVSVTRPGRRGRQFRAASDADLAAVEAAEEEANRRRAQWEIDDLIPIEPVPPGQKTDELRTMGLLRWQDLFTSRQLLVAATAVDELRSIVAESSDELGREHARALNLYLSFALDKALDYNSMLASWHSSRTLVRNTFDFHNFAFKWSFAEFDGANALLPWAVNNAVLNHKKICALVFQSGSFFDGQSAARAEIHVGSAIQLPLASKSMDAVVTDPPYYDNVMYGELAEFFHVWLRRSLRDTWPELSSQSPFDRNTEAVANSSLFETVATHSGRGKRPAGTKTAPELADEHYERILAGSFVEAHRVLKDDGVMTVMFTHKRVDAWDTLGQSLLEAGFAVHSSWPVETESEHSLHQADKNAASSTIFLTCRKRGSTEPAYWSDLKPEVTVAAREAAEQYSDAGITGIDLTIATFGPVLSVLSRRWPVYTGDLDDDGNPRLLRPDVALDLAREEVARLKKRGLLGGRDVEFDRITDWYLLAWTDFGAHEFPSGEALKLSIATHLDLDDLATQHRVVRARSGTTTLLTPAQRRTAGALSPEAASWPTFLDALHALMVTYDEDGLAAASAWLDRTGKRDDQRFADLVAAALHAIPRVRDKGDFVRPEARTLEGLRATLFDNIPAPDDTPGPAEGVQGQLAL